MEICTLTASQPISLLRVPRHPFPSNLCSTPRRPLSRADAGLVLRLRTQANDKSQRPPAQCRRVRLRLKSRTAAEADRNASYLASR
jgi:hypothetical protein